MDSTSLKRKADVAEPEAGDDVFALSVISDDESVETGNQGNNGESEELTGLAKFAIFTLDEKEREAKARRAAAFNVLF